MVPKTVKISDEDLAGLTILVVEDHTDSRELLVTALEQLRAKAIPAASADSAFELLQLHQPHVIVSDIGLPGEDGLSFIRRVRGLAVANGGATPAIALTAFCTQEDRRRALASGFHLHLTKPVDIDHLVEAVATVARPARSATDPED